MSTATRLAAYAAVVAIAFGGAAGAGALVGPLEVGGHGHDGTDTAGASDAAQGLAVADAGYRLVLDALQVTPGAPTSFGFTIVDTAGHPATSFEAVHERRLHLIVLSRDLVHYHHVHPVMAGNGHWSVALPALEPGSYRVFADFTPTGAANRTLAADVSVAGPTSDIRLPEPANTFEIDGYTVTRRGDPGVGDREMSFTVARAGQVVTTEPYLGAAGHLVAIRVGDLAYLHVHPHEATDAAIPFTTDFPTAGTYRLFLDFSHEGIVRTAAFTVIVGPGDGDEGTSGSHDGGH